MFGFGTMLPVLVFGKNWPAPAGKKPPFATAAAAAAAAAAANWNGLWLFLPGLKVGWAVGTVEDDEVDEFPGEEDDEETQGLPSRTSTGTATRRGGGGGGWICERRSARWWCWRSAAAAAAAAAAA